MKNNVQNLTLTALMTALLCVMGPIAVPMGMIPISLTNMFIYFVVLIFGKKMAMVSAALYLLMGFAGLPVFSGFSGGAGKILGPTGGYLCGYLILSYVSGGILELCFKLENRKKQEKILKGKKQSPRKQNNRKIDRKLAEVLALTAGTVCLYLFGTLWLMYQSKLDMKTALWTGVVPFVVPDVIKIFGAVVLGEAVRKRLQRVLGKSLR